MAQTQSPYVVYNREQRDYLYRCPDTGRLVTSAAFDNAYYHSPAAFEQELAQALADEMNRSHENLEWKALITTKDCPSCGRELLANDMDVCYPNNRERTSWRVGCNVHDWGCGLEVSGDTYVSAVTKWNAQELYAYSADRYLSPTGRKFWEQEALLKQGLNLAEDISEDELLAKAKHVSSDTESPLHYVALHYLAMVEMRKDW